MPVSASAPRTGCLQFIGGAQKKKKRYSRSDGAKTYGEKLRRIRATLGVVFKEDEEEVILFSERETQRESVCV